MKLTYYISSLFLKDTKGGAGRGAVHTHPTHFSYKGIELVDWFTCEKLHPITMKKETQKRIINT